MELNSMIAEKMRLLSDILNAALEQQQAIEVDDIDLLTETMSKRQKMIDRIDEIDAFVSANFKWPKTEVDRVDADKMIVILDKIKYQDKVNEKAALARMDYFLGKMSAAKDSHKGALAYQKPVLGMPIYIDKKN